MTKEIGRVVYDGTTTASQTITLSAGAASGYVAVVVSSPGGSAGKTFAATDSKGNTYTSRFVNEDNPTNLRLCILTAPVTTALVAGDTITITVAGGNRATWACVAVADENATAYDVTVDASGTSSSISSGTVASTSAVETVIGALNWSGSGSVTPPAGWTPADLAHTTSLDRSLVVIWKTIQTAGDREATGTLSTSTAWCSGLVAVASSVTAGEIPDGWHEVKLYTVD